MTRKVNQTYDLDLLNNGLVKYHRTRYYLAFWDINRPKKTGPTSSNIYETIEKYHFYIY